MDFVLVSNRSGAAAPHWSRPLAGALARALSAAGRRVHWLCASGPGEPEPPPPAGVAFTAVRGRVPPFRSVVRRNVDVALDVALAHRLRPLARATVVHIGFGAPGSIATLWVADRMGARSVAFVRAAEVVCHRQDLVFADGAPCGEWTDPDRCARCCTTAGPSGPSRAQERLCRWTRPLGPLQPFPRREHFAVRNDLMLASLQTAAVLVGTETERAQLVAAGLGAPSVRVVASGLGGAGEAAAGALAGLLVGDRSGGVTGGCRA